MTSSTGFGPRTMVAGDSWVRGLFRGQDSIATLFPRAVGASDVLDLSKISRTVPDTAGEFLADIERFRPELALLAIGGADSLVFPAQWFQRLIDRFAPPEWAGVTGLMPPAVLPSDRRKRLRKRIETAAKTVVKQVVVTAFGARQRVPAALIEQASRELLNCLDRLGTTVVVTCSEDIDPWTFPRSRRSLRRTNAMLDRLCASHPRALYVHSAPMIDSWGDYLDDHVHLTPEGHTRVTRGLVEAMVAAGGAFGELATPSVVTPTAVAG